MQAMIAKVRALVPAAPIRGGIIGTGESIILDRLRQPANRRGTVRGAYTFAARHTLWFPVIAFVLALVLPGAPAFADAAFPILVRPVAVSARLSSASGTPASLFVFTVTVSHDQQAYAYRTSLVAVNDLSSAIAILKRTIGWRGGYLFARQECGGGNAWRCNVDQIFALRSGRLIRVGEQIGGQRSQAPGTAYRNGHFVDVYDRLEINDLTSHAGAPWFRIYLVDHDGILVADLPFTWRNDLRHFESSRRELARIERDPKLDPRARHETIVSLLLHNAALARYCRHPDALAQTEREAKRLLTPEVYVTFQRIIASVEPGEMPRPRAR
ncbi:MAG: hypothetical protein ACREX6_02995 [Casimicrobiaceae bacterium]